MNPERSQNRHNMFHVCTIVSFLYTPAHNAQVVVKSFDIKVDTEKELTVSMVQRKDMHFKQL